MTPEAHRWAVGCPLQVTTHLCCLLWGLGLCLFGFFFSKYEILLWRGGVFIQAPILVFLTKQRNFAFVSLAVQCLLQPLSVLLSLLSRLQQGTPSSYKGHCLPQKRSACKYLTPEHRHHQTLGVL